MIILCQHCQKSSDVIAHKNDGINALNLKKVGFYTRLPILLGISEWIFTCSRECYAIVFNNKLKEHNVTEETKTQAKDDFAQITKKLNLR
jgi:hypothetical protein